MIPAVMGVFAITAYLLIISFFTNAWVKRPERKGQAIDNPFISVIIPFRNEAKHLPILIKALNEQDYPKGSYEIIAIDDHSNDSTVREVSLMANQSSRVSVIGNEGTGKKSALKTGILKASGNIIVTIDADCLPDTNQWLASIAKTYTAFNPALIIGPVKMKGTGRLVCQFQELEFMALQLSGAAAALMGYPVYCSAANLCFRKDAWLQAHQAFPGKKEISGDDVFLLHAIKKLNLPIVFMNSNEGLVSTHTEGTVSGFLRQRMRWGGKSKSYTDAAAIALALIVLLTNLYLFVSFIVAILCPGAYPFFLIPFLLKFLVDFRFLKSGRHFFNVTIHPFRFLVFSMVYPVYVVLTGFGGLFFKTEWKGRK